MTETDIQILLYDGFDELDAIGPYEVFASASEAADLSVSLVTIDPCERVTASHDLRVEPDGTLGEPDLLVVPGGGWNNRSGPGAWTAAEQGEIPDAITRLHGAGTTVASVCTGGMLLARAGVLDGRPAVTHHGAIQDLREYDVEVRNQRVVDDGDIVTAGGVTSGLDLALHLLERLAGREVADRAARRMEYDRR